MLQNKPTDTPNFVCFCAYPHSENYFSHYPVMWNLHTSVEFYFYGNQTWNASENEVIGN